MTERLHFHFSLSCIGEGNGNPLQFSCLENPRDGGAWWLPSMGSHRVGHHPHPPPLLHWQVDSLPLSYLVNPLIQHNWDLYNKRKRNMHTDTHAEGKRPCGCRGPAPADPGYLKERRPRRPIQMLIRDIKSNRMRIAQ